MKRREFLRSAGAAAVLPVLPLPAMATPVATAPVNAMQVGWAALYARANHTASPALLQKWLRLDPAQANAMMSELVKRNVVHAPIAGSAAAVQPMYSAPNVGGLFGSKPKIIETAKEVFDTLLEDDVEADEPEPEDQVQIESTDPSEEAPIETS